MICNHSWQKECSAAVCSTRFKHSNEACIYSTHGMPHEVSYTPWLLKGELYPWQLMGVMTSEGYFSPALIPIKIRIYL